ncbi:hypothetical protein SDC9_208899 [bioreactor metagenome]|uniref:Uncharacterized protein n=1 Tax=bioreactor metagenome TaxID=1076179 RepID=A0A645JBS3_9ZZZZ
MEAVCGDDDAPWGHGVGEGVWDGDHLRHHLYATGVRPQNENRWRQFEAGDLGDVVEWQGLHAGDAYRYRPEL